jgi:hypothetical protein
MVLLDHTVITVPDYLLDLDADPFVPDGWMVKEHRKGGQIKGDAYKVSLYPSTQQKDGKWIEGNKLRGEVAGKSESPHRPPQPRTRRGASRRRSGLALPGNLAAYSCCFPFA